MGETLKPATGALPRGKEEVILIALWFINRELAPRQRMGDAEERLKW